MELTIVRADPAGNITIFVLDQIDDPCLRLRAAKALLAEPSLKAEQVGFVIPPDHNAPTGHWRLEMMGGEFCGNAARSFGLYAARESGLRGTRDIRIGISGVPDPIPVRVDLDASTAEAEIPGPRAEAAVFWEGRSFPVLYFEGITHVIAGGVEPDRNMVLGLVEKLTQRTRHPIDAVGVMFYDPVRRFMRPAVYVAATESLVFESSCGSGTAALAAYLSRELSSGEDRREIFQPGGIIEARVTKEAGKIKAIGIGGPVSLDDSILVGCQSPKPSPGKVLAGPLERGETA
jgi:diaminopimelate epimerase